MRVLLLSAFVALFPVAAQADQAAQLGRTITDVRVEIAGLAVADANVLNLIETRVGEPLAAHAVRNTINHLVGLGRFEDVRVLTAPSDQGVALRWQLTPVRRISQITVTGNAVLPASAIRAEIDDRHGGLPSTNRLNEIVSTLQAYYADRGFPKAVILPRIEEEDPAPERVELVLSIDAGARVTIGAATVTGAPLESASEVLAALNLQAGRPYDRPAIDARITAYEESLRERGYYEARVRPTIVMAEDARSVSVTVNVDPGPRVSLVFAGDPAPDDVEDLVPIRAERSVDQDLLEDASVAIENALREQGYRSAQAPYSRQQKGNELILTFTISRGLLHRVESIDVAGNAVLERAAIAPLLQVKPGEPFVQARIGAIAAAITELYRVRGFAQVVVTTDIQLLPEATGGFRPVAVRFDIIEGPATIISSVEVDGAAAIPAAELKSLLGLAPERPFYRPQLSADRDTIERVYRARGFKNVSVVSQLAFADNRRRVAVTWMVREGDQITIDRVLINGNSRIATELIRDQLTIGPGSPMSDEAMIESQRRLAELGLFRRVRITELPRSGSLTRDVLVDLEEADTTTIDYGGGFEVSGIGERDEEGNAIDAVDFGPRGFIGISRRNLWGKNRSVTVFGRVTLRRDREDETATDGSSGYGFPDYRGLFTFREPRAFGTTGDAQFTAFVEQARRTSFDFNRRGMTSDYARRIGPFTVTGRYTFDYTKLLDERISVDDQLIIDRLFPQVRLSKFSGGVLRDSRDDVLDPQRGAVIGVDTAVAAKAYGSEVGFAKSFAQGFIYRRLPGRGWVLAAGARLGVAVGFAQDVPPVLEIAQHASVLTRAVDRAEIELFPSQIRQVPASERFFAGGDTTVRGFSLDRLGSAETLDRQGFPQGGNGLTVFNLEMRAPYWQAFQLVWFLDAGNVFKEATDIRLNELRASSGIGFRYRSPIGPLRVDWGWKLATRLLDSGGRERSNVLHISLGQAF
ncbi:MAG TPA: POTRA domain-containing protein [Vicinamibacterales bacterium]|nr:POTRA domain-containing protein [Vicinamibacterales bacterium]